MKLLECTAIILHLGRARERKEYVDRLCALFPNHIVLDAVDSEDLTEYDKSYYRDMKNFKRMPTLKEESLFGRVCCFLSHKKAYHYIVTNKIDNAIIFEDDAYVEDESLLDMDIPDHDMVYLGYNHYVTPKETKIISSHAIYYSGWRRVARLLSFMTSHKNLWKSFDLFLNDYILPTADVTLLNIVGEKSSSGECKTYVSFSKTNKNWIRPHLE